MSFINRPVAKKWVYSFIFAGGWIVIGMLYSISFFWLTLPFSILLAATNMWNGILFIRYLDSQGALRYVLGWLFIFWGIHKGDYPLLYTVEWFAPYGYLIGAAFEFTISALLVLLYMQRARQELTYAHNALKESKERLELAFTGSNDGLWDWNIKSDYLYCSPRYKEILEFLENEEPNNIKEWENLIHLDDVDRVRNAVSDYLNKRFPFYQEEYRLKTKSGDYKWILTRGKAIWDNMGSPLRMVGSHTDITDRKNAEFILQKNMEEAKQFQQKLLPSQLPLTCSVGISTEYIPAGKVGGDIYDLFKTEKLLIFFIADVSGKGVPAAMMSAYIKSALRHCIYEHKIYDPDKITNYLKGIVANESLFSGKFVTLFVGCVNLDTLKFRYSNAGQCFPVIQRSDEIFYLEFSQNLLSEYFKDIVYATFEYQLRKGDKILFYTDGLYEWEDSKGFFGFNRFMDYISLNGLCRESLDMLLKESHDRYENHDDISYILMDFYDSFQYKTCSTKEELKLMTEKFTDEVMEKLAHSSIGTRVMQSGIELIVNAFEHGNKFDAIKNVQIEIYYGVDMVKLSIKDEGEGFDWEAGLESSCVPDSSLRGRGIFLARNYADEIVYNEKGNEVKLLFSCM